MTLSTASASSAKAPRKPSAASSRKGANTPSPRAGTMYQRMGDPLELVTRDMRRQLRRENQKWPLELREIPRDGWPEGLRDATMREAPVRVWRSRGFLVMLFAPTPERTRLSVCRTEHDGDRWRDGVEWDDLQRLKREAGFGDTWAVECYPADFDVVNVANMRHLWLLPEAPPFAWRRR